jgi:hypothetical protein
MFQLLTENFGHVKRSLRLPGLFAVVSENPTSPKPQPSPDHAPPPRRRLNPHFTPTCSLKKFQSASDICHIMYDKYRHGFAARKRTLPAIDQKSR